MCDRRNLLDACVHTLKAVELGNLCDGLSETPRENRLRRILYGNTKLLLLILNRYI